MKTSSLTGVWTVVTICETELRGPDGSHVRQQIRNFIYFNPCVKDVGNLSKVLKLQCAYKHLTPCSFWRHKPSSSKWRQKRAFHAHNKSTWTLTHMPGKGEDNRLENILLTSSFSSWPLFNHIFIISGNWKLLIWLVLGSV